MPILLEFVGGEIAKSNVWRELPRVRDRVTRERTDVVADKGKSTRKVVVTIWSKPTRHFHCRPAVRRP
jgi:hypothetical protein